MNIAAVVKDLSASQNAFYMIKEFNKLISNTDISVGAFIQRPAIPTTQTLFGYKMSSFINSYSGVLIPTSLEMTRICLKASSNTNIFLYLWDLDWLESPVHFSSAMDILRNDKVKIIARSHSHAECIENFCNKKPVGVVSNWDARQLLELINAN